jgi:hypothetical protein
MDGDVPGTSDASRFRHFLPALATALLSAGVTVLPLCLLTEELFTSKTSVDFSNSDHVMGFLFLGIPFYALMTLIFSIVPVSVIGAVLMWFRVRSLAAFALAGALASMASMALIMPIHSWASASTDPDMSGFVAAGAIGGLSARLYLNYAERRQRTADARRI